MIVALRLLSALITIDLCCTRIKVLLSIINKEGTKVEILLIVIMPDQAPLAFFVLFLIMSWLTRRLSSHLVQYYVINTDENEILISTAKLSSSVMHVVTRVGVLEGQNPSLFRRLFIMDGKIK